MKPKLIFVNGEDGKVDMTYDDLLRIVDDAYQAGLEDGSGTITTVPYINPMPTWTDHTEITTCHSESAHG